MIRASSADSFGGQIGILHGIYIYIKLKYIVLVVQKQLLKENNWFVLQSLPPSQAVLEIVLPALARGASLYFDADILVWQCLSLVTISSLTIPT